VAQNVTRCAYCRTASSTTHGTCPQCGAPSSESATDNAFAVHDPCEGTAIYVPPGQRVAHSKAYELTLLRHPNLPWVDYLRDCGVLPPLPRMVEPA
jgi:hypothetical protein